MRLDHMAITIICALSCFMSVQGMGKRKAWPMAITISKVILVAINETAEPYQLFAQMRNFPTDQLIGILEPDTKIFNNEVEITDKRARPYEGTNVLGRWSLSILPQSKSPYQLHLNMHYNNDKAVAVLSLYEVGDDGNLQSKGDLSKAEVPLKSNDIVDSITLNLIIKGHELRQSSITIEVQKGVQIRPTTKMPMALAQNKHTHHLHRKR
jgi:hypothetical protein